MDNAQFVEWVEKNAARVHEYKLGHDGSDGLCDCIGLIIGAWRMSGNKWPWTHGSNYTARYLVTGLGKDQPLHLGDLVFKGRNLGDSGYDLPSRYKNSGDLIDYYHVGVVTSTDPLVITHCTSVKGGIKRDSTRGNWKYSGEFSKLQEGSGTLQDVLYVTSQNGQPVNLRQMANTNSSIVARVPVGEQVNVLGVTDTGWTHVTWKKYTGWMMSKFLTGVDTPPADGDGNAIDLDNIEAAIEALKAIKTQADNALALLTGGMSDE